MKIVRKAALAAAVAGIAALASAGVAAADSGALGGAYYSPGVLSGNVVQIPVHVPVNLTGNSVNVIGALNPALGNASANG